MELLNDIPDDEDTRLWRVLPLGDVVSFEKLINRTYDILFQYGSKFSRDKELIKDSIQDVFMEIWEKREFLNINIPPKAYLLASLRRRLHRLAQRNRLVAVDDFEGKMVDLRIEFSAEYRFIESEQDQQIAAQITLLLNELPKRQKEAIYLKFFSNLDRDEIASIMDIHPQSVSNLLQTAFKVLKAQWKTIISIILTLHFI
jgi:RNA polymerase sigma factor (sigma-70 family)